MQQETKNCQNCKQDFTIEPEDFAFYAKIQVPLPTFCPECRQQRRYSWRNERTLYRRNCDLCSKSIVTIYNPISPFKVYCSSCWWSDAWDSKDFAQEIDFSRPFFEQFLDLQLKVPRVALLIKNSIQSEYTNHAQDNKNCYLCFDIFNSENVLYSSNCWDHVNESCDCNMIIDKGTFLYECISCDRDYNCQFCLLTHDSINCSYCYDCRNCSDCFMSYNLRNKKYCIFNKEYSKDEYILLVEKYKLDSFKTRNDLYKQWIEIIKNKAVHRYGQTERSINVSGDVINNSKNCHNSFDIFSSEDIKYSVGTADVKDAMDIFSVGIGTMIYESHAMSNSSYTKFSHLSWDDTFIEYCDSCHNSQNLFGCAGLKKSNYCILNRPYEKEEYELLKNKLIEHMKKEGEYGEFFPSKLSPFGYNETQGQIFMPLLREQALAQGFSWQDNIPATKGKETIILDNLADRINDIDNTIINEVLKCVGCERNYNIVQEELKFYMDHVIPLPRYCPNCRYEKRIALRPERKLFTRSCMCDLPNHNHIGKCEIEFETSYAPNRPEMVYCEKCYQKEVL